MSLINQVLNELEARGTHTAPDQTQIRAVPRQARHTWFMPFAIVTLFATLLGLAAWIFMSRAAAPAPTVAAVAVPLQSSAIKQEEAAAPSGAASQLSYELTHPASAVESTAIASPVVPAEPLARPLVAAIAPEVAATEPAPAPEPEPAPSAPAAPPRTAAPAVRNVAPPVKQVSPQQRADAAYRKGLQAQYQKMVPEALAAYEAALRDDPAHEGARLALAALLLEHGQSVAAEKVLRDGLKRRPLPHSFVIALARLQLAQGDLAQAQRTLHAYLKRAADDADYQAFYAAVLQRQEKHAQAVEHYRAALQRMPRNGMWHVGLAISLQALARKDEARQAYEQALATRTLTAEQSAFVQQKLSAL